MINSGPIRFPSMLASAASFVCLLPLSTAAESVDFNRDIRPILSDKCFHCHGPDGNTREADLRLDTQDGLFGDRDGSSPVAAGDPDHSLLIERIFSTDDDIRMPPVDAGKQLTGKERDLLRRWVQEGARWNNHWSFQSIQKPAVPDVSNSDWCRQDIDRFVFRRLDKAGLAPNDDADRTTLIRRVTLDLTGLPPTQQQVAQFLNDSSDDAYENLIDRLLNSKQYGEHMAWWWLDAARYADSDGYESDPLRNMWPWRDWVIAAFNENMTYDQFLIEQLAGDMLPDSSIRQKLATGFNRNHRLNNEGGILPEEWIVEYVCDRAETTATVFMGLTWGCARCHDHKFDPITQKDYYQLFAFFNRMDELGSASGSSSARPMMQVAALNHLEEFAKLEKQFQPINEELAARSKAKNFTEAYQKWLRQVEASKPEKLPKALADKPVAEWDAKLKAQAKDYYLKQIDEAGKEIESRLAPVRKQRDALARTGSKVMIMTDSASPRESFMLTRGQYDQPTEKVEPGTPDWLPPMDDSLPRNRLGLARWLVSPEHPLTARIAVNRIWERFFGAGLVRTQEDFGSQGESPSHPELLDHLATSFIESGWDVKGFVKQILMSSTYRQSSSFANTKAMEADPENKLLWRAARYRMAAAMIRDQSLFASGLLADQIGGSPVKPYQPAGLWKEIVKGSPTYKPDKGDKLYRRSLYTLWRRAVKPPLMMLLDSNERDTCRVSQRRTNTPLQALLLLNDVTFVEAARELATRVIIEGGKTDGERIDYAMQLLTARQPTDQELQVLQQLIGEYRAEYVADPEAAKALIETGESVPNADVPAVELATWTACTRLLLNLDEVVTRE